MGFPQILNEDGQGPLPELDSSIVLPLCKFDGKASVNRACVDSTGIISRLPSRALPSPGCTRLSLIILGT